MQQVSKANRKAYKKAWYEANKERLSVLNKAHYEANKELILERTKKYRETHKEEISERNKRYREANKERISEYFKDRYKDHKEKICERINTRRKVYRNTKPGRAKMLLDAYKQYDKKKERGECTLTVEWIIENIFSGQVCHWCGESDWMKLGCDRIDNALPHTPENVVCSCEYCNKDRKQKSYEEYRKIVKEKYGRLCK